MLNSELTRNNELNVFTMRIGRGIMMCNLGYGGY